jgi:phosphate transport system permease protein
VIGAVILGLGRALGETMAVTMVIGNCPQASVNIFAPSYTLAAVIANEFAEAVTDMNLSVLIELALILLFITLLVNGAARILIWKTVGKQVN